MIGPNSDGILLEVLDYYYVAACRWIGETSCNEVADYLRIRRQIDGWRIAAGLEPNKWPYEYFDEPEYLDP